jgi:hypothetical protein
MRRLLDPPSSGGKLNAAGFSLNQYVRPYMRRDGTPVNGYWRNSPSDGLPTHSLLIPLGRASATRLLRRGAAHT